MNRLSKKEIERRLNLAGECNRCRKPLSTKFPDYCTCKFRLEKEDKLKEEFNKNYLEFTDQGVMVNYIGKNGIDIDDWINQNYISKEEILGLEELKEELEISLIKCPETEFLRKEVLASTGRNQLRNEIKEAITNLKTK